MTCLSCCRQDSRRSTQWQARGQTDNGDTGGGGSGKQDLDNGENGPAPANDEPEQHARLADDGLAIMSRKARPSQNQCLACGKRGHNRRRKDCPVLRQEDARNENARDECTQNARNERRPETAAGITGDHQQPPHRHIQAERCRDSGKRPLSARNRQPKRLQC